MNVKNIKSPINENADANITCDFGDGDIIRFRSRLPYGHIVSSIIVRLLLYNQLNLTLMILGISIIINITIINSNYRITTNGHREGANLVESINK